MQARSAHWTGMPADRQAFGDLHTAARTPLAGIDRRHGDNPLPSVHCFGAEDTQELRPSSITDTLGEMVVPDQVGRLHVFVIDRIAAGALSGALWRALSLPSYGGCSPSCGARRAVARFSARVRLCDTSQGERGVRHSRAWRTPRCQGLRQSPVQWMAASLLAHPRRRNRHTSHPPLWRS
jgi:hypothetical protein